VGDVVAVRTLVEKRFYNEQASNYLNSVRVFPAGTICKVLHVANRRYFVQVITEADVPNESFWNSYAVDSKDMEPLNVMETLAWATE